MCAKCAVMFVQRSYVVKCHVECDAVETGAWFFAEPLRLTSIHLHDEDCRFFCNVFTSLMSGFRREVDDNCALLGHYATSSGNFLPTFRDNLSVPPSRVKKKEKTFFLFLTLEYGTDRLSRNVGKGLPLLAA